MTVIHCTGSSSWDHWGCKPSRGVRGSGEGLGDVTAAIRTLLLGILFDCSNSNTNLHRCIDSASFWNISEWTTTIKIVIFRPGQDMPGRCWWARSRRGPRGTSPGWGWWSPRTGSTCCWTESTGRGLAAGALVGSAADYLISMMPEVQTVARRCLLIDLTFNLCLCVVELWVVPSWVGRVVAIEWTATNKIITFQDVGVTNTKFRR